MKWFLNTSSYPSPMLLRMPARSGVICGWNDVSAWRKIDKVTARECAMYVLLNKGLPR